jgi:ectoine hydroxylase-related dioxygenase (phytanoyl-CoA dioxygenase family)
MINKISESSFFQKNGYVVVRILNRNIFKYLKKKVLHRINSKIKKNYFSEQNISKYHKILNDADHQKVIKNNRYVKIDKNVKDKINKNVFINNIMRDYWGHNRFVIKWIGSSLKKSQIKNGYGGFRVSRPVKLKKFDTAGAHCDIHVGGRLSSDKKIMITAWFPLEGFSKKYTLMLYEKSHSQLHDNKKLQKRKNSVSRIFTKEYLRKYKRKRLNMKPGEAILLHPNLIHGGGENFGSNSRLSIEVRMYNINNIIKYPVSLSSRS